MIGPFGRLPFNRPFSVDVYGSFSIDLTGEVSVAAVMVASPTFDADLTAEMIFDAIREKIGAFLVEAVAELEVSGTRERTGQFAAEATVEVSFSAGRMHVDVIEFSGEFKPGDQIVIDNERLRFLLNNQNALHLMNGDFFDLNTGENEIIYTDNQSGRMVRMRITFRNRYV